MECHDLSLHSQVLRLLNISLLNSLPLRKIKTTKPNFHIQIRRGFYATLSPCFSFINHHCTQKSLCEYEHLYVHLHARTVHTVSEHLHKNNIVYVHTAAPSVYLSVYLFYVQCPSNLLQTMFRLGRFKEKSPLDMSLLHYNHGL